MALRQKAIAFLVAVVIATPVFVWACGGQRGDGLPEHRRESYKLLSTQTRSAVEEMSDPVVAGIKAIDRIKGLAHAAGDKSPFLDILRKVAVDDSLYPAHRRMAAFALSELLAESKKLVEAAEVLQLVLKASEPGPEAAQKCGGGGGCQGMRCGGGCRGAGPNRCGGGRKMSGQLEQIERELGGEHVDLSEVAEKFGLSEKEFREKLKRAFEEAPVSSHDKD